MQAMEKIMAQAFLEHQLREQARWREQQARWDFVRHHRRNPAHRAWKKRRASGRA